MDGALGTLKELGAKLALQDLDLLRQRRLGDTEAPGSAAEVKLFGQDGQILELTKLHERDPGWTESRRERHVAQTGSSTGRRRIAAPTTRGRFSSLSTT